MKAKADRLSLHQLQTFLLIRRIYVHLLIIKYLQSLAVKVEDGNLLSTGYLNQRTGAGIVNISNFAVARLNPGEGITTAPIIVKIPESAPYRVIIEAEIENTYYHYGKPDQVTAPGMKQNIEATISETTYRAFAAPEHLFYPAVQPVVITGQAINNTTGTPMPDVPVKIGISVKGFDRYFSAVTDNGGNFSYTFTPGPKEAGIYSVWAVHPDVTTKPVQATFTIAGLQITPEIATVKMVRNRTLEIPVRLTNTGGSPVYDLQFIQEAISGLTVGTINNGPSILQAGETLPFIFRIVSSNASPDKGYASLTIHGTTQKEDGSQEILTVRLDASITMVAAIPLIETKPSYVDTGMVRGDRKTASFIITNAGDEVLRNARLAAPSTPWMTLNVNNSLGDMDPKESRSVGILFRPGEDVPQGIYDDKITIYSDNHIPYTVNIQVTVTSNTVGNVLFDVLNEFMEDVPEATITFQHQSLLELIYIVKTGGDGTAMKYDIPEGRYTYTVSPPPRHLPYSNTFSIEPGKTTVVPIALEMKLVDITWSVTPTAIQDRYEIIVNQTFETHVPVAVIITEPPSMTLPKLRPGEVFNGEFTITNKGLISAEGHGNFNHTILGWIAISHQ